VAVWGVERFFKVTPSFVHTAQISLAVAILQFALLMPMGIIKQIQNGFQDVYQHNIWLIGQVPVNVVATVLVLKAGGGLFALVTLNCVLSFLYYLMLWWWMWMKYPSLRVHRLIFDKSIFKKMVSPSLHYFVLRLGGTMISNTDSLVIGTFLSVSLIAAYSVAYKFCQQVANLIWNVADNLFPFFTEAYALGDFDRLKTMHAKSVKITMALTLPLVVYLAFFGRQVIELWVGKTNFVGWSIFYVFLAMTLSSSWTYPAPS